MADCIVSSKGQKGDMGPQGIQGIQGPQGVQGIQGAASPSIFEIQNLGGIQIPLTTKIQNGNSIAWEGTILRPFLRLTNPSVLFIQPSQPSGGSWAIKSWPELTGYTAWYNGNRVNVYISPYSDSIFKLRGYVYDSGNEPVTLTMPEVWLFFFK